MQVCFYNTLNISINFQDLKIKALMDDLSTSSNNFLYGLGTGKLGRREKVKLENDKFSKSENIGRKWRENCQISEMKT